MKKTQIIKDSLYDYLKERGYSYISERDTWVFRKEEEEIRKEIVIHDIYGEALRFDFSTNVGGTEGNPFIDKSKVKFNVFEECEYQNEQEFRVIINEIKEVIVSKGEEIFADISVISDEQRLAWEMEKQLFENYEQLIEKGRKLLEIENETNEEKLEMIIEQLKIMQGKKLQEVREELLMVSAVYGLIYEEEFEGKLEHSQKECKIKCKGNVFVFPLVKIILYWEYNDEASYKNMINRYQYDKNKYNRSLKQRNR